MKPILVCATSAILAMFSIVVNAQETAVQQVKDSTTGETFPKTVSFDFNGTQYNLGLTGTSTRKKFFVKVYTVASYLQNYKSGSNTNLLADIMQDSKAKQLTINWVHDVPFGKVQEGFIESFNNSLDAANFNQIQNQINQFVLTFNSNVTKGDVHLLRWIPGGNVEIVINNKTVNRITNIEFAKALWGIWFGDKSVVDRSKLVSGQ